MYTETRSNARKTVLLTVISLDAEENPVINDILCLRLLSEGEVLLFQNTRNYNTDS